MCGRYVSPDQAAIERHWHIGRHSNPNPFDRRFNVSPTSIVPILRLDPPTGELELVPAVWGLIPPWWKEGKPPRLTFNARSEEAATKPLWRGSLGSGRCLVPAEGWYEWRQVESVDPQTGEVKKRKQPYFIHSKSGEIFCFAGVMCQRKSREGSPPLVSCAILTTAAAPSVQAVHERMPVVLSNQAHRGWLDPTLTDSAKAMEFARAHTEAEFGFYPVSQRVNVAKNEDPLLIEPISA